MKNDTTTTMLNFVLAVLVILGVAFALWNMRKMSRVRSMQQQLPAMTQRFQNDILHMQGVLNDVIVYNKTANSPELAELIKAAQTPPPAQPATK